MQYATYSNRGKMRDNNEDSYLVRCEPLTLMAVADGMGGHQAGEVASRIAVDFLDEYRFNPEGDLLDELGGVINQINREIFLKGQEEREYFGMGTTLSLGIFYRDDLYIGHIGDSRIYLFRNDRLKQLTTDHSLVNRLVEEKKISPEEAFDHPKKHILTQALGSEGQLLVERKSLHLQAGDLLLFCTDGLSDMIRFAEIESLLRGGVELDLLSKQLGEKAMENGGLDNITLIICKMG